MAREPGDGGGTAGGRGVDPAPRDVVGHHGPGGHHPRDEHPTGRYLAVLSLAALGVVFGDIGTSPIYALRESLHGSYGVEATQAAVLGVLSLIFWSLILVLSLIHISEPTRPY